MLASATPSAMDQKVSGGTMAILHGGDNLQSSYCVPNRDYIYNPDFQKPARLDALLTTPRRLTVYTRYLRCCKVQTHIVSFNC
jgi:hypothetical protein